MVGNIHKCIVFRMTSVSETEWPLSGSLECISIILKRRVTLTLLFVTSFQAAKEAYHSVMVIRPRRPVTENFLEFEQEVMKRAVDKYNYPWPEDAEVDTHVTFRIFYKHRFWYLLFASQDDVTL